mmetsp:Transcript_9949/g.15571  ORF Transcript_9949/g.15571 Transcript_9949/m.15571 type:complete len:227 (-) Transcript_9949:446-1126(-)
MFRLDGHLRLLSDLSTKQELSRAIIQNNIAVSPSPKVGLCCVDKLPASHWMMPRFEADERYVFQIPVFMTERRCEWNPRDLQISTMEELQRVLRFHFPEKLASGAARFHDEGLSVIPRLPFNYLTRAHIASIFKAFRMMLITGPVFKCFQVVDGASTFGPPTTLFPPIAIYLPVPAWTRLKSTAASSLKPGLCSPSPLSWSSDDGFHLWSSPSSPPPSLQESLLRL